MKLTLEEFIQKHSELFLKKEYAQIYNLIKGTTCNFARRDLTDLLFSINEPVMNYLKVIPFGFATQSINKIPHLVVPSGVEKIDGGAFLNAGIKELVLPESLRQIEYNAFGYNEFEAVIIPEGVTQIHTEAFKCCTELRQVQLPSTIKAIGLDAFDRCPIFKTVTVNLTKEDFKRILKNTPLKVDKALCSDGVLRFNKEGYTINEK